ncbi:MAG: hypothetical protein M1299_00155 [Firmicutes bacterium]|nr:hypothetical protein [Bacillota bacterium]MCL5038237.1 hypothetical protein [Bacillota bacterium]
MKQIVYVPETDTWVMEELVEGRVEWDEQQGLIVIIDGVSFSAAQFWRSLGVYEGWGIRIQFLDPGDWLAEDELYGRHQPPGR